MGPDGMAVGDDSTHDVRMSAGVFADKEEGRRNLQPSELIEHGDTRYRIGAVVERQRDRRAGRVEPAADVCPATYSPGDKRAEPRLHPLKATRSARLSPSVKDCSYDCREAAQIGRAATERPGWGPSRDPTDA